MKFFVLLGILMAATVAEGADWSPLAQGRLKAPGVLAYGNLFTYLKVDRQTTNGQKFLKYSVCLAETSRGCHASLGDRYLAELEVQLLDARLAEQLERAGDKKTTIVLNNARRLLKGELTFGSELAAAFNAAQSTIYEGRIRENRELFSQVFWYYN